MLKLETVGAVHTHTHTITFTKGYWKISKKLQSRKIGFGFGTQKFLENILTIVKRNIRQKLYVCKHNTCICA